VAAGIWQLSWRGGNDWYVVAAKRYVAYDDNLSIGSGGGNLQANVSGIIARRRSGSSTGVTCSSVA